MCFANYREAFVNVAIIDIKTRRKNNLLQLQLKASPTKLHQIDPCNLLVGTEGGKIEHWKIDGEGELVKVYDAHPESAAGISVIMEIKSQDPLIRGEALKDGEVSKFKLLATASLGAKEFRLWHLMLDTKELQPYLKIETTIEGGIKYLLETQPTQLVAANDKALKFYDFIDKAEKEKKEQHEKQKEATNKTLKKIFTEIKEKHCADVEGLKINTVGLRDYFVKIAEEFVNKPIDDDVK